MANLQSRFCTRKTKKKKKSTKPENISQTLAEHWVNRWFCQDKSFIGQVWKRIHELTSNCGPHRPAHINFLCRPRLQCMLYYFFTCAPQRTLGKRAWSLFLLAAAWSRLCLGVLLITCLLKSCSTCKAQIAPFRCNTPPDNCLQFVSAHYLDASISFNQLRGYCDDVYWAHILGNVKRNSECEGLNRPW